MSTQFYVAGPAYVFVGLGGGSYPSNLLYFGYTESGLQISIESIQEDVQTDYSGGMPADVSQMGQTASVTGTFPRYDENVAQIMSSFYGPNGIAGLGQTNAVGTLMVTEGISYPLFVYAPYGIKTQYSNMLKGLVFPTAYLAEPYRNQFSVRPKKPEIGWRAIPLFGTESGGVFTSGTQPTGSPPFNAYQLYSTTLPSPLPTPT